MVLIKQSKKEKFQRITAQFTPAQREWIAEEAGRRGISESEFLRRIVDEYSERATPFQVEVVGRKLLLSGGCGSDNLP